MSLLKRLSASAGWITPPPLPPQSSTPATTTAAPDDGRGGTTTTAAANDPTTAAVLNVGILGAATIAPAACTTPLKLLPSVGRAYAVAARSPARAHKFARANGVGVVHDSYDALLADPRVDAVFVPTPNGLHHKWAAAALRAGKHVLCEKPLTANAAQARDLARVLREPPLVAFEAYHWCTHPVAHHFRGMLRGEVDGWDVGAVRSVQVTMCIPGIGFAADDIRFRYELAGGALMDLCYVVHVARFIEVLSATPTLSATDARVDTAMEADILFKGSGVTANLKCNLKASLLGLNMSATVTGESGATLTWTNFILPSVYHAFEFKDANGGNKKTKKEYGLGGDAHMTTYWHQMRRFLAAARGELAPADYKEAGLTPLEDSVVTMSVIDDIYRKAGLPLRE
ncbi:putative dehydrogenase [Zopfochytrium polystomum]|nr:putative dehydrogenase [Zopfochytrium polystomum]